MSVGDKVLLFLEGLTELQQAKPILLGPETINFYPATDGYVQNYPGREDYFDRAKGDPDLTDGWGVPPLLTISWSRIFSFYDFLEVEHLVAVGDNKLYEIVGNTAIELYEFKGRQIGGVSYPRLFVHESKLVILNQGDEPLLWNGVDGVHPLGVSEIPPPPEMYTVKNPYAQSLIFNPYTDGRIWGHPDEGMVKGGGTDRDDGAAAIQGWYRCVAQYVDAYGNHGKVSPSSPVHAVAPEPANEWKVETATVEWSPPRRNEHVHFTRIGRTLTLNPDDAAPLGEHTVFFSEAYVEGTSQHRRWLRLNDATLSLKSLIDMDVHGPPSGSLGFSFANRIWIYSEGIWWFSDLSLFGQFRSTQQISPYSQSVAGIPAGDRVFIIGESSTEVWYESAAGPALLEQDFANGSSYGSSFVAVGDGVVFGLWNAGFGFYDGKNHKYVDTPYFIKNYYVGTLVSDVRSAVKIGDWYRLSIRKDNESTNNNIILMFNFSTGRWYIVEDTVNDIAFWNEEIVGVDDSVYILYRGGNYPISVLSTAGVVSGSLSEQRTLSDLRVLMEPSSIQTVNVSIFGEEVASEETGTGLAMPIDSVNRIDPITYPYWSKVGANYGADWYTPGDAWLQMDHKKPVPGFYHKVKLTFPVGHQVRVKALELTYSRNPHRA